MAKPVSAEIQRQADNKYYRAGFLRSLLGFFANYVNFTGRSSRSEYWWVALWRLFVAACLIGGGVLILVNDHGIDRMFAGDMARLFAFLWLLLVGCIIGLAIVVPTLSLEVRRFRDAGWSWWWLVGFYGAAGLGAILLNAGTLNAQPWATAIGGALILATALFELVIDLLPSKNPPQAGGADPRPRQS